MSSPSPPSVRTSLRPGSAWNRLGRLVLERPRATVAAVLLLAAAAAAVAGLALRIRPGYVELLSPRSASQARYLELLQDFGNVEALYVVVQSEDRMAAARVADALAPAIAGLRDDGGSPLAVSVLSRVDRAWFTERLPAWLPLATLESLTADEAALAELASVVADPVPEALVAAVRAALERGARAPEGGEAGGERAGLEALASLVRETAAAARGEPASLSRWLASLPGPAAASGGGAGLDAEGRLLAAPGAFLLRVRPANVDNDANEMARLLDGVRAEAARLGAAESSLVQVRLTGAPALLVDEMRAATHDMTWTTGVAFALVCVLFVASFASVRHSVHAALTLACGLALTFGAAWVLVGYLNLFSAVFASILVGLGIDYGIHVVTHYEALRRAGAGAHDALMDAFEVVGPATTVGASANAAAFFSIMLADFRGFSQLGLISGAGLLLCLAVTFTLLPALMLLSARGRTAAEDAGSLYRHDRRPWTWELVQLPLRHPRAVAAAGVALVLLCLAGLPRLAFDYNLLNLQPAGTDAAALAEGDGALRVSTHLAHVVVPTLEEARSVGARLAELPSVASVHSAASLLPEGLEARRPALQRLAAALAAAPPGVGAPVDGARVSEEAARLEATATALQDLAFEGGHAEVVKGLDALLAACAELREACARPDAPAGLARFRDAAAMELGRVASLVPELAAGRGLAPADLPPALASALVGASGRLAVVVEPRETVWDRPALERFVAELRSADARVTGPPVQILDVMDTMRRSCVQAGWISLVAILLILAAGFRHATGVLLALAPLVAGFVVMLGAMAWLGVPLNPANLIALPIILGSGVDNGVPMVHRWLVKRDAATAASQVGHAVIVCALESLAGFGALVLASHRGVRSFGVATCIGAVAMLVTALWLLPAVLVLLDRRRGAPTEAS